MSLALPAALSGADAERRAALRRMRIIATSLLVIAAIVYVFTREMDGIWGFVNAGAEAAMVGAIADWFAVTALFRHPLGIPIPHTALIPKKKDMLGESLQEFVTDNFLRADVVRERLETAEPARRIGTWLDEHADRVVAEGATVTRDLLARIDQDDARSVLEEFIIPRLVAEPLSPAVGELLAEVIAEQAHVGLLDLGLDELHGWVSRHPDRFIDLIKDRAPTWSPRWATDVVADKLFREALRWVDDVRRDPRHQVRRTLDAWLIEVADDLRHDPAAAEKFERLKERMLAQPQAVGTAVTLWDALRVALLEALEDADGPVRSRVLREVRLFAARMQSDTVLQSRVDGLVSDGAEYVVEHYGTEIATVISATVDRWDGKETAERIELHVGKDLQFIRINGTVVGGLAGVVIHAFAVLL